MKTHILVLSMIAVTILIVTALTAFVPEQLVLSVGILTLAVWPMVMAVMGANLLAASIHNMNGNSGRKRYIKKLEWERFALRELLWSAHRDNYFRDHPELDRETDFVPYSIHERIDRDVEGFNVDYSRKVGER